MNRNMWRIFVWLVLFLKFGVELQTISPPFQFEAIQGETARLYCPIIANFFDHPKINYVDESDYIEGFSPPNKTTDRTNLFIQYIRFVKYINSSFTNVFTAVYAPINTTVFISANLSNHTNTSAHHQFLDNPPSNLNGLNKLLKTSGKWMGKVNIVLPNTNILNQENEIADSTNAPNFAIENNLGKTANLYTFMPYLEIKNVRIQDAGYYICMSKMRNALSRQQTPLNLEIFVKPTGLAVNYSNEVIYEGNRVTLNCSVLSAKPRAQLIWKKSGQIVGHPNQTSYLQRNDGTWSSWQSLTFQATRELISIIFTCYAENAIPQHNLSHLYRHSNTDLQQHPLHPSTLNVISFKLNLYVRPLMPSIEMGDTNFVQNQEGDVACKVKGANPMPQISWELRKGNFMKKLNGSYHTVVDEAGSYDVMNILRLRMSPYLNGAELFCLTSNQVMDFYGEIPLYTYTLLNVFYAPLSIQLSHEIVELNVELKSLITQQYTAENNGNGNTMKYKISHVANPVNVICDTQSNPISSIQWYNSLDPLYLISHQRILALDLSFIQTALKNRTTVSPAQNKKTQSADLIIPPLILTCRCSNAYGYQTKNLTIKFQYRPICKINHQQVLATINSTVKFKCEAYGMPEPHQYYFKKLTNYSSGSHNFSNAKNLKTHHQIIGFQNGSPKKDLLSNKNHTKRSKGTPEILSIKIMSSEKYGTYACKAQNSAGISSDICTFTIKSADKPKPVRNCTISHGNSTFLINCPHISVKHPFPSQRYMLQSKNSANSSYQNITHSHTPLFSFPKRISQNKYAFRVLAFNEYHIQADGFDPDLILMTPQSQKLLQGTTATNIIPDRYLDKTKITIALSIFLSALVVSVVLVLTLCKPKNGRPIKPARIKGSDPFDTKYSPKNINGDLVGPTDLDKLEGFIARNRTMTNFQNNPMNYRVCLSSFPDVAPLVCTNLVTKKKRNDALENGRCNNLIYADVEIINKFAQSMLEHTDSFGLPINKLSYHQNAIKNISPHGQTHSVISGSIPLSKKLMNKRWANSLIKRGGTWKKVGRKSVSNKQQILTQNSFTNASYRRGDSEPPPNIGSIKEHNVIYSNGIRPISLILTREANIYGTTPINAGLGHNRNNHNNWFNQKLANTDYDGFNSKDLCKSFKTPSGFENYSLFQESFPEILAKKNMMTLKSPTILSDVEKIRIPRVTTPSSTVYNKSMASNRSANMRESCNSLEQKHFNNNKNNNHSGHPHPYSIKPTPYSNGENRQNANFDNNFYIQTPTNKGVMDQSTHISEHAFSNMSTNTSFHNGFYGGHAEKSIQDDSINSLDNSDASEQMDIDFII